MSLLDGLLLAQSGECRVALAAERRQRRGLLRFQRSDRRAVLAALRPELRCQAESDLEQICCLMV